MITDEALYEKIRQGDLAAFDVLYERYRLRLFRFIYSYLKNEQESEEVFHEALMKLLKAGITQFDGKNFQAWIFEIARNLCLNHIRSKNRSDHREQESIQPQIQESADVLLSEHDSSQKMKIALKKLSATHAEVLNLKLLGLPEKEIASVLDIPLGTVKSRFFAIIEFMKKELIE